ncbi:MAG: NADH-quinone oxidoreductase subunit C, partial [Bacillota bacterium]|nr:NADH-quinone oxidoreductase subunit C [Bacillota bacterium]
DIAPAQLIDQVKTLKEQGCRLVQMCCTKVEEGFLLLYTFEQEGGALSLKMVIPEEEEIQSISGVYWPAFIYENEMQDLFGVKIKHIVLNYGGHFFKVSQKTPWNPKDTGKEAE